MLEKNLIHTLAFKDLKHYSVRVYILLKDKFNGSNGDDLSLTYREASEYMQKATFKKAIDDLVEHGFIEIKRPGGLFNRCNIFALSDNFKFWGK